MIDPTQNYAFVDLNDQEQVIHGHEVNYRNGWTGVTTYYRYDAVTYNSDDFICISANSNVTPGTDPTLWSYLVQIEGDGAPVINAGSDYIARSLGSLAYNTALEAYALAQTGTNLIYIETGSRVASDQYLQTLITAESGSRVAADQAIISFVFGSIAVDLTAETGSRIAADIYESGTRSEADQYLQTLILETSGSIIDFVFGSIAVDLTNETGSRIASDNYEAGTRSEADQYLQNQIVVESGSRYSADQTIVNLVNETYNLAAAGTIPPPLSTLPDVNIPAPSVNQVLAFDGSQWVAMDAPSQVAPGAFTLYLENTASGSNGYWNLRGTPSGLPEDLDTTSVGGGTPFVYDEGYITGPINRTRLDGGIWEFNTYSSVSNGAQSAQIIVEVYTAANNGAETLLFTGTSSPVSSTDVTLNTFVVTQGSFATAIDDRLLVKYYWLKTSGPSVTAAIYHSGSEHASHIHTPIGYSHNDLGGLQGGSSTANQFYHVVLDTYNALQGTSGTPTDTNRFVTQGDLNYQTGTLRSADVTEQGTRSEADQYLQNQIEAVGSQAALAYELASVSPAFPDVGNRLISGGNAVWVSGYTFRVEPTTVDFNGTAVSFPQTDVTLTASDPVDNRLDLIIADNTAHLITYVTGTASTPPTLPDYDPVNQFQLTFIPVDAATTQPGNITRTWIYRENTEWAVTSSATINPNSLVNPFQGAKDIEGTNALNNHYFYAQAPLAFVLSDYDTVYFYIAPKAGWGTRYLRLHWETSGGARRGNYVSVNNGAFGFNTGNTAYQLVAIPLSLFGVASGTSVQRLRATVISSAGAMPGFYIDDIALQVGVAPPSLAIPDATTSNKGIVLLATNGGSVATTVVQGNDYRLALAVAEPGTRSSADQFLQNQITATQSSIVVEQGTRSSADQFIQTQVTTQTGVNVSQQAQLDSLFALLGVSFSGTFAWWMSQIRGGLTDTKLNVINGIVAGVTESTFSWEDFEFYGTGSIGSGGFNKGTSWNGAGVTTVSPLPGVIAEEIYTTLSVGPVSSIPATTGTGWASAGTVGAETTYGFYGSDALDTYATGTVTAGQINAGFNWAGTATITAK